MPSDEHFITVVRGKTDQTKYILVKSSILVGRETTCDICLPSADLSPIHVLLQRAGQGYIMVQKGSRSVQVNGRETPQAALNDSDEIQIGSFVLKYHACGAPSAATAAVLPGLKSKDADAPPKRGANTKTILLAAMLGVYLLLIPLGVLLWMMLPEEPTYGPLAERLTALEASKEASSLDKDLRERVYISVREALGQELVVPRDETIGRLRAALQATVVKESNPYADPSLMDDSLRAFIREEINRQYAVKAEAEAANSAAEILPGM